MSDSSQHIPRPPSGYRSWQDYCFSNPDDPRCERVPSFYMYRMSLEANAVFVALFGLSLIGFVATYVSTRRGVAFTVAFVCGVILEILGYVGRLMSWKNQFDENGFLMQICCLTIAPAFLAAGIYLCLRRIVYVYGPENSRIRPEMYTRIFIPCDILSLVLQAVGGAMASIASHNGESIETGDNIMIAGLSFQVFTLLIFMACSIDFAIRVYSRSRSRSNKKLGGNSALDGQSNSNSDYSDLLARQTKTRSSTMFKGFLGAIALSTICIFWRSVFRVAELSGGWEGELMGRQDLFIGFEGVMIIVACLVLNVFHPSVCFREMMEGAGGFGRRSGRSGRRKGEKTGDYGHEAVVIDAAGGKSEGTSDTELTPSP